MYEYTQRIIFTSKDAVIGIELNQANGSRPFTCFIVDGETQQPWAHPPCDNLQDELAAAIAFMRPHKPFLSRARVMTCDSMLTFEQVKSCVRSAGYAAVDVLPELPLGESEPPLPVTPLQGEQYEATDQSQAAAWHAA